MNWDLLENKTKQKTNKKTENKPNQTQQLNPSNFSFAGKVGDAGAGFTKRLGLGCTASN